MKKKNGEKKCYSKKVLVLALGATLTFGNLSGCIAAGLESPEINVLTQTGAIMQLSTTAVADYKKEDTNSSWDLSKAGKISLNGTSIIFDGSGATVAGNVITITKGGVYAVTGTLVDGYIAVAATNNDIVQLVLNGADITNKSGAAIYASQCDKLIITLADGTENHVTDGGENFTFVDTANEEPNAALFCKDDLSINGTGKLTVNAGFNNGIGTKDDLVIAGGTFVINAANHGIRGNDSVTILNGSFEINAGNDGIQTSNGTDAGKGWIAIEGGVFNIISAHDGIQAETDLNISGGEFNITAGGGTSKASNISSSDASSDSFKGIKAVANITVSNGNFIINSADDSVHANGNVTINGGEFTLSTGDDGIHADSDLTIYAGIIDITKSYEGLEGNNIYISGGDIKITASDDGINAAGGSDQGFGGGRFGMDRFASAGSHAIDISGGNINLYAGGDGLDSNGSINVSGGYIVSLINSSSDNEAIDCDGSVIFTGGTIIYGGTGAGFGPGTNSSQSYVIVSSGVTAGNEVSVKKDGKTLVSFVPEINCRTLAISSPDIIAGESYEVYSGTSLTATVTAGTGATGMGGFGGGRGNRGGQTMPGDMTPPVGDMPAPGEMNPGGFQKDPRGNR